jgi:GGDEF domain-containing protein
VTTLFGDPDSFRAIVQALAVECRRVRATRIAAVDARGFIIGGAVAFDYAARGKLLAANLHQSIAEVNASHLVQSAVSTGALASNWESAHDVVQPGPLMAVPLRQNDGVIIGVLCMDRIPVERLNKTTATYFQGIADWISASLGRLQAGGTAIDRRNANAFIADVTNSIAPPAELADRLQLESERFNRLGVPFHLLAVQASEWSDTSEEGRNHLHASLHEDLNLGLRSSDRVYEFGYPGCFIIVLAGTDQIGATVVKERLERRLRFTRHPTIGQLLVNIHGYSDEVMDLRLLVARIAQKLRAESAFRLAEASPLVFSAKRTVGDRAQFVRAVRQETNLALRNGWDLHAIDLRGAATAEPDLVARHAAEVAAEMLRRTDMIYCIGPSRSAILLPATTGDRAFATAYRLLDGIQQRMRDAPYGELQMQVFALGNTTAEAMAFMQTLEGP